MTSKGKKGVSAALIGVIATLITLMGTQFTALYSRVTELENKALELTSLKFQSENIIVKLEHELKRKGTRLDAIESYIDHLPLPAWIKRRRPDGKLEMVVINRAFEKKYGISKQLYEGATDDEIWPLEFADSFRQSDEEVLKKKNSIKRREKVPSGELVQYETVWKFYLELPGDIPSVGGVISC